MSSVRQIVVDDSDLARIQYSGGWTNTDTTGLDNIGHYGSIFNGTSHGTTTAQSLSFNFIGTSVSLFGTNQQKLHPDNTYSPGCSCFIDTNRKSNSTDPSFDPGNNWNFCDETNLTPGHHTLNVQVASLGETFWVDYIRYTPLADASFSPGETVTIHVRSDDTGIKYSSGWHSLQGFNSVDGARQTQTPDSHITFSFVGTQVEWFGWQLADATNDPSQGSYTIDGGSPVTFPLGNPPTNVTHPNIRFFSTPELSFGTHTLVVTYLGGPGALPTPLILGYLTLTGTSITPDPVTSTSSSTSPTSTSPTTSSITSSSSTTTPAPQSHGPPIGAIVGGVVGGLGFIALTLLLLLWRRRRKLSKSRVEQLRTAEPFMSTQQVLSPPVKSNALETGLPPYSRYDYLSSAGSGSASGSSSSRSGTGHRLEAVSKPPLIGRPAAGWTNSTSRTSSEQFPMEVRKPPLGDVQILR